MSHKQFVCDPKTGLCHPIDLESPASQTVEKEEGKELIYVGDPMCSWCWGISNHLRQLKEHFDTLQFRIVVGGLRPGGGGPWNEKTKSYLQHHWEKVHQMSGQPFGDKLFQLETFHYDTEPSCRAIVASRQWMGAYELDFYEEVSRKFYVENEDPKQGAFYQSVCERFAIPFEEFAQVFEREEIKEKTREEFILNRNWGIMGYPSILLRMHEKLHQVSHGYADFDMMKSRVEGILSLDK